MKAAKRITTINGLKITYYQLGQGPPLLFLHGGRLRALTFQSSLQDLSKRYTVIAPDIPGYGASDTPRDIWSFTDYASFFNTFLSALKLRTVTLLGYSMGGGIAGNLAAMSDRVTRLVLADASGLCQMSATYDPYDLRRLSPYLPHPTDYIILSVLIREYLMFGWKHRSDKKHMQRIRRKCFTTSYEAVLGDISVPTLLVWGHQDQAVPLARAYELQKRITGSQLKIVSGRHGWPLREPLLFSKSVL